MQLTACPPSRDVMLQPWLVPTAHPSSGRSLLIVGREKTYPKTEEKKICSSTFLVMITPLRLHREAKLLVQQILCNSMGYSKSSTSK